MHHRLHWIVALGSLSLVALWAPSSGAQVKRKVTLAFVVDGEGQASELRAGMQPEIGAILASGYEVTFRKEPFSADFTPEGARKALDAALADPGVDVLIGIGPLVTHAVVAKEALGKPVVLPHAEPDLQALPLARGTSGRKNLVYLTGLLTLERDLRRLKDLAPFKKVAVLLDEHVAETLPGVRDVVARSARALGVQASLVVGGDDPAKLLAAIPADADAVYLTRLPRLAPEARAALIRGTLERKLFSYSTAGPTDVQQGVLISAVDPQDEQRRQRRVGLLLERILGGEDAGSLPVAFEPREQLSLNPDTASALGLRPRSELLMEASVAPRTRTQAGSLDLRSAVRAAMDANRDVAVRQRQVLVRNEQVNKARGRWLPQVGSRFGMDWIDPDAASPYGPSEGTLSWGIQASQKLYGIDDHVGLSVSKQNRAGAQADLQLSELDAGLSAAVAYLEVLRAHTTERINRDNLERTQVNLSLAEVRVSVGTAGRDEVYRWQSDLAQGRSDVLRSMASARGAMVQLNRVINQPLEQQSELADVAIADVLGPFGGGAGARYIESAEGFDVLRNFMAQLALEESPELAVLDRAIDAQDAVSGGASRRFFVPEVAAQGGFDHQIANWGAGTGAPDPSVPADITPRDPFNWWFGVNMTLPLFEGTQRIAALGEANEELSRLRDERASLAQQIEQRTRAAFLTLIGSYPAVDLARQASEAAAKNLEVVTDNYRRGATDILRLIDAQNQALISDLAAAQAVYDFLVDYVTADRSTGSLSFMQDEAARAAMLEELAKFEQQNP